MLSDDEMLKLCGCEASSPTALVVLAIGRAVERAAYERAAKECENRSGPIEIYNRAYPHYLECAAAIRARGRQR